MHRHMWYLFFFVGLIGLLISEAYPAVSIDTDKLGGQTVKITVRHQEGIEIGAGVILCDFNGQLFILTAKHVLSGVGTYDKDGRPSKRFRGISEIKIEFHKARRPPIKGGLKSFDIKRPERKDLALLRIPISPGPLSTETAVVNQEAEVEDLAQVYTTGHPVGLEAWSPLSSNVMRSAEFIVYAATLDKGYSGGPLVNEKGELIGINTHIKRTPAGVTTARAIPIDEALNAIKPWIVLSCLTKDKGAPPTEAEEKPISQARIGELVEQIERQQQVEARGEVKCGDNESLNQCKARSLEQAKQKAAEEGRDNLAASLPETDDMTLTREKILQRVRTTLLSHEVADRGFVGDNGYFYKIRAVVKGEVPADLRRQMLGLPLRVRFTSQTLDVTYDQNDPTEVPYGTKLTVTASKTGYQSKTLTRDILEDNTVMDFGTLERQMLTVRFSSETPGVTYDKPNPSQVAYGGGLIVTASKEGYRDKTLDREAINDDTTLNFGKLIPLRVTVSFVSETPDVVYDHPNPISVEPRAFLRVEASKPGYISKTLSIWVGNEDTVMAFGSLELSPVDIDVERLPSRTIEGFVPLWLLNLGRAGLALDAYSLNADTGDFRLIIDTGFPSSVNEKGERLRMKPYVEVIGRQVPTDPSHLHGFLVMRSPDGVTDRALFEERSDIPPMVFDFKVDETGVLSGQAEFPGGRWQDSRTQFLLRPARVAVQDLQLSQRRITGEIDLNFDGLSIEDAYARFEMEPVNVRLTDRDPNDGEMALSLGLNGAAFMKKQGLLWHLDKGRLDFRAIAQENTSTIAQLEFELGNLEFGPAWLQKPNTPLSINLVVGLDTPNPDHVMASLELLGMLIEHGLQSELGNQRGMRFMQRILTGQLLHRLLMALDQGLELSLKQFSFVIDGIPNHVAGRLYWYRETSKLEVARIMAGDLNGLLRLARVELGGTVAVEPVMQLLGVNDENTRTLMQDLITLNWVRVDERGRVTFDLLVDDGKVYVGGKDVQKLIRAQAQKRQKSPARTMR